MDAKRECPECHGAMEEGFLLDRGHYDSAHTASWIEGEPERSFWTGIRTAKKARFRVRTFRCERCGLLRSYADATPE
jgi:hypothetical protein